MVYGYARVSTQGQKLDRQIDNILKADSTAKLFTEKYTGTTAQRPEWQKLLKTVKENDTIIFDSISRMSRNAENGIKDYKELYSRGIELVFIKEPYCNTAVYKQAVNKRIELDINTGKESCDTLFNGMIDLFNDFLMDIAAEQINIAFISAEKEVIEKRKCIKEGMAKSGASIKISESRTGNTYETKKSIEAKEQILKHSKSFGGSLADTELISFLGISRNSYYKYKAELQAEVDADW